ncbi:hypothetical protein HPB49_020144 [Dermacentor silvarum]|uniref:Uncharacterized protein n=1 Tax=Dermacentor silvarum TaxID=543639 RepID=A0ACB8D7U6_DERSI|nr:hypothetical protein HPB49_020144 [Dermacentor silvarum]
MESGVRTTEPLEHVGFPCTKLAGASCQLLRHLDEFNPVLLHIGTELRADERLRNGADLRVGIVPGIPNGFPWNSSFQDVPETTALNLLAVLLENHRCITAVEFNGSSRNSAPVLSALRSCRSIKSVTVCGMEINGCAEERSFFEAIGSLDKLEELLFTDDCPDAYKDMRLSQFPVLVRGMRCLTTLDVACLDVRPNEEEHFIQALTRTSSIVDLTVGQCVFASGSGCDGSGTRFARYLRDPKTTLQKLTLRAKYSPNEQVLRTLVSAVSQMTTLREFNADFCIYGEGFARKIGNFAEILNGNELLRIQLPSAPCSCLDTPLLHWPVQPPEPDAAQGMQPWTEALRAGCALRELTIDLRRFGEPECISFLQAVAANGSLRKITILHLPATATIDTICGVILQLRLEHRVRINDHHVSELDVSALPKCSTISKVTVNGVHFLHPWQPDPERLHAAFEALGLGSHVKSLRVECVAFDEASYILLAAHIEASPVLAELKVNLPESSDRLADDQRKNVSGQLVRAIARSVSLTSVTLTEVKLAAEEGKAFAESALRRLVELHMLPYFDVNAPLLDHLASGAASHFSLLVVELHGPGDKIAELAAIQGAAKRNGSLVEHAAHFVLNGAPGDDCSGARAIELVHQHPRLVDLVRDGAGVEIAEALAMVRSSVAAVRRCSLDEFMRLAGVVRQRVECSEQPGTGLQLTDIGETSWWHIRQIIRLADVVWP